MRRALTLLAAVATGLGLLAAPASAERVTGRDARADVAHRSGDGWEHVARPTADLTRYGIRYGGDRVSAVLHYRDLKPRGRLSVRVIMITTRGSVQEGAFMGLETSRGDRAGTGVSDGRGGCPVRHRVDYRHDLVRLSVPAGCVGRARFVDVVMTSTFEAVKHPGQWTDVAPEIFDDEEQASSVRLVRVRRG
jgi:hypothetical protein